MKLNRLVQISSITAVGALSSLNLSAAEAAAAAPEPVAPSIYTNEQLFEVYGYFVGQDINFSMLELTDSERAAALKGLEAAFKGTKGKFSRDIYGLDLQRMLDARHKAAYEKLLAKGERESTAFFNELKKNPNVRSTPSGLYYEIIEPGSGEKPKPTDTVKGLYTASLIDGTQFENFMDRNKPAEHVLSGVIPAYAEGMQLIGVGGKVKVYIPAARAFGATGAIDRDGRDLVPPNSAILLYYELLQIMPSNPAPATN